jgi:hypothetical protein
MKRAMMVSLLALLTIQNGFTAGERTPAGGRAWAMGGTSVSNCDFWSVTNNQAGTAWLHGACIGFAFDNRFMLKELMSEQLGFVMPLKAGTFGVILNRFGDNQYSEFKSGISYARKFGEHFSTGVQFDYLRIHINMDNGNKNLLSSEIGLMYQADHHLCIGVQILNPYPVKITENPAEQLPADICIGLSYQFSGGFVAAIEAEKDLKNPVVIRTGAEYHFAGPAFARIGISTSPMSFTFGFGLIFGKTKTDIASGYHQALGFSPSGSVIYSFR